MNIRKVGNFVTVLLLGAAIGLAQNSTPKIVVVPSVPDYLRAKIAAPDPVKVRDLRTQDGVVPLGSQLSIRVDDKIKEPSKGERRFFEAQVVRDLSQGNEVSSEKVCQRAVSFEQNEADVPQESSRSGMWST